MTIARLRQFRRWAAGVLAFAALSVPSISSAQTPEPATGAALDEVVRWYMNAPVVGMTIAVSRPGHPVEIVAYGHVDPERTRPTSIDTVYEIGSITKTFTAALVLRQVERGRIGLDDPVLRFVPELGPAAEGVTVRHLLAHTSGLPSGPAFDDLTRPVAEGDLINVLRAGTREFEPGARFRYNNNGYGLLGLILERVAGSPYAMHLESELLIPLGLGSTRPCKFDDVARPRGMDHSYIAGPFPVIHPRHHPLSSGSAGLLCSTAADVLAWQAALMEGRVLSPGMLALMVEPQGLTDGSVSPYGLGMFVDAGGRRLHHGGAVSGFITQMAWRPEDRVGVVVLTNGIYSGALVERLEQDLARAAVGATWTPPMDMPAPESELSALAGSYQVGPARLDVFVMDGHLRARPQGQVAARLLHLGGGRFQAEHDPELMLTFSGDGELLVEKGGRSLPPGRKSPS